MAARAARQPGQHLSVGRPGAAKILVFKNQRKDFDGDPDFNVFVTEPSPPRQDRPSRDAERGRASCEAATERAGAFTNDSHDAHVNHLVERFDQQSPDDSRYETPRRRPASP